MHDQIFMTDITVWPKAYGKTVYAGQQTSAFVCFTLRVMQTPIRLPEQFQNYFYAEWWHLKLNVDANSILQSIRIRRYARVEHKSGRVSYFSKYKTTKSSFIFNAI